MIRKTEKRLNVNTILRLSEIFKSKSWDIVVDDLNQSSLFNRFCTVLSELSLEQQLLILELTERFTKISSDQYNFHIKKILEQLITDSIVDISKISNIHIAPLIAPEDFGKNKSSLFVQYSFQDQFHYNSHFANKNFQFINGLAVDSSIVNAEGSILFVVDDFIGTGETACSALNYLFEERGVSSEKVIVISIAALNQGISKISELGVRVFASLTFSKGISEFYSENDVLSKRTLMESIENKIKIHRNERFGYGGSEALIKMIRTPNNTFPVFWKEKKERIAPFPR